MEKFLQLITVFFQDLLEVKHALIDTHCLTEDRKKTVDALNAKVARLEQENAELRGQLDSQEKEFVQVDQTKSKVGVVGSCVGVKG